jgi:hypothetical protein
LTPNRNLNGITFETLSVAIEYLRCDPIPMVNVAKVLWV